MPWLGLVGSFALLTAAQAPLAFPTSAELVYVVVSVTDASGQPVSGLTAKDFILGFAPSASTAGRSHKLKVQVARKDASVRHRLAYETKAPR